MSASKSPSSVSITARSIISRLQASADKLSTTIEFKCILCKDTGLIEQAGRYRQCKSCPKEITSEPESSQFF